MQEYFEGTEHGDEEAFLTKDKVTAIFQKANKFTGHHITQSHVIWNAWAEFETQILDAQEPRRYLDILFRKCRTGSTLYLRPIGFSIVKTI